METQEQMRQLWLAKDGDTASIAKVATYVWERFGGRISKLYSPDKADDWEDLRQVFWQAVIEHIPKIDHRGSPYWHLSQRGYWRVGAYIRHKKAVADRAQVLSLDALRQNSADEDGLALHERVPDHNVDVEGVVTRQIGAVQEVLVAEGAPMPPVARRAFEALLTDDDLDPGEQGFNKRLAKKLGVSPQRASQAMSILRRSIETEAHFQNMERIHARGGR